MNSSHLRIDDHEKQVFSFSASWFSLRFIISNKTKASENKRVVFEEGNHLKRQFFLINRVHFFGGYRNTKVCVCWVFVLYSVFGWCATTIALAFKEYEM